MLFNRRHYQQIAQLLRDKYSDWIEYDWIVNDFAEMFKEDNVGFDAARFKTFCNTIPTKTKT